MRLQTIACVLILFASAFALSAAAQGTERVSTDSGDWNDRTIWTPHGTPTKDDEVIIRQGHVIQKDGDDTDVQSLEIEEGATLTSATPGEDISITAKGTIEIEGTISTRSEDNDGEVRPDAGEDGGSIVLTALMFDLEGSIVTGSGGHGDDGAIHGGDGGDVKIRSTTMDPQDLLTNNGTIQTGDGGRGGSTADAEASSGDGGNGGSIFFTAGNRGEENYGTERTDGHAVNAGSMQTGNGGEGGPANGDEATGGNGGNGGHIALNGRSITNEEGKIITGIGGDGGDCSGDDGQGGDGGDGGKMVFGRDITDEQELDSLDSESAPDSSELGGTIRLGHGGEHGTGGSSGGNGAAGTPTRQEIRGRTHIILRPSLRYTGEHTRFDAGAGELLMNGLLADAIVVDGNLELVAGSLIDLRGIPAGTIALRSNGGQIRFCVPSADIILLDSGVALADICLPAPVVYENCTSPAEPFTDGFEAYELGSRLDGQGGWHGWDAVPDFATRVTGFAYEGDQSVSITTGSDTLREFDLRSGHWRISAKANVAGGSTGSFWLIFLNGYQDGGPNEWGGQVEFDATAGEVLFDCGGQDRFVLPLVTDAWFEVQIELDLDADLATVSYDGTVLGSWAWSSGTFGDDEFHPIAFEGFDLYGTGDGTGLMYVDDVQVLPVELGTALCFGDGSAASCGCGNEGPAGNGGCLNSTGVGARLSATGSDSLAAGDLVLAVEGAVPGQPGLFFQGDSAVNGGAGIPFGDGLRCCGSGVARIQVVFPDAGGSAATSVDVGATGGASAGDTRCYQCWYRDPAPGVCGTGFNLSNAVQLTWRT